MPPWDRYRQYSDDDPYTIKGPPKEPPPQTAYQSQADQLGVVRAQQQIGAQPLQNESTQQSILSSQQQRAQASQQAEQAFGKTFAARPEVQAFGTIAQQYGSALRAAKTNNKAADLDLINAYAKILDPGSVVREGEVASAGNVGSVTDQVQGYLSALKGGGRLTPEQRNEIIGQIHNRASTAADQYRQSRQYWGDIARKQYGYDPDAVLGPNPAQPFQQIEADYFGHPIKNGNSLVYPSAQRGGPIDPNGTGDIGFNQEAQQRPSGQQMSAYSAFMAANPKASADQLRAFGKSIGWDIHNADAILKAREQGAGYQPGSEAVIRAPDIKDIRGTKEADAKLTMQHMLAGGGPLGVGAVVQGADQLFGPQKSDAFMRGVADIPTFGMSEEIMSGLDPQRLARQNAIRDYDKQNNFGTRLAGQLAGGFGLPLGEARTIPQMMRQGAGVGAAYGFGSTDGGIGQRALGAVEGGAAGAATAGLMGGGMGLARRGLFAGGRRIAGAPNADQQALALAAREENVPLNMSDVYPGARNTVATLETIPGAAGRVQQGIAAGRDAIEGRVQALGRGGTARENMGDVIQGAGDRFVAQSGQQADRLYNRARNLADNTPVRPQNVMQVLAGLVRDEAQTPGGTRAGAVIQRYAEAFESGGPITIDGARRMRSELLSRLRDDGGLTRSQAARITGQIMGGVNADIEQSLTQAGRGAAVNAYRQADRFYSDRMEEIGSVTEKLLGTDQNRKSPEQTLSMMQGMLSPKGDSGRAAQMIRRLTPEERRDFAATIVEPLGRRSADEPFSPTQFISNVRKISPAARRLVFGNDGERSINNLIRLSNAKRDTIQSLNNSRSGQVSNYRAVLSTLVFGLPGGGAIASMSSGLNGATGAVGGAALAATGLGASRGIASLLMNPEFTAALASAPGTVAPRAIGAHMNRLRDIASRNPELQAPFRAFEDRLVNAMNDNIGHAAAASDDEEKKRRQRYQPY